MAYLNAEQRQALKEELEGMTFNQAKFKLRTMDRMVRLKYYRNSQQPRTLHTLYELAGLGTRVTLVETHDTRPMLNVSNAMRSEFELAEVIVEPTPDNRL